MNQTVLDNRMQKVGYEIYLESFGRSDDLLPGHVYGPALTRKYFFQYCVDGFGEIEVDGQVFPVKAGECVVNLPGQTRIERADMKKPWSLVWIGLSGESADAFFERLGITPERPVIPDCRQSSIPRRLEEVIAAAEEAPLKQDFLLAKKLFAFMEECMRFLAPKQKPGVEPDSADTYVEQAIYYMNMHFAKGTITVQSLAEQIGLNRSYFYEIFKEKTGLSPQEYLTRLRMEKACEYLRIPEISVTTVAYSVGYEPSVFSRAFKNAMGMSPGEYRRRG